MTSIPVESIELAAQALVEADALFIGAGAGMGVDSGLPDFRGNEGFWKAYPPFKKAGLSFVDMANPAWFDRDAARAWGFYGHRLNLYRKTEPHRGFDLLLEWARKTKEGGYVFTSNVDGQFQRAGFPKDRIAECHGSILHLQCATPCCNAIWSADGTQIDVDEQSFLARPPLPMCPHCGGVARPNILMFGDGGWLSHRSSNQEDGLSAWLEQMRSHKLVVIEMGAGSAVPTVRWTCQQTARAHGAPLVRINPREPEGPEGTISLAAGALAALGEIETHMAPLT